MVHLKVYIRGRTPWCMVLGLRLTGASNSPMLLRGLATPKMGWEHTPGLRMFRCYLPMDDRKVSRSGTDCRGRDISNYSGF